MVLDAPEASKLLSAVAIALSNCSRCWVETVILFLEVKHANKYLPSYVLLIFFLATKYLALVVLAFIMIIS